MAISKQAKKQNTQQKYKQVPVRASSCKKTKYKMRLFVAGDETNSIIARKNIDKICSEHLDNDCDLQIIDVFNDFSAAIEENILVAPALIIDQPKKLKIFGNLEDTDKLLSALEIK